MQKEDRLADEKARDCQWMVVGLSCGGHCKVSRRTKVLGHQRASEKKKTELRIVAALRT